MKKLGTLLQEANVIDEIQLIRALSHQRKWHCRLGRSLIELGYVTEETIAKTIATQMGFRYVDLNPGGTPRELLEAVPKQLATEKQFFPVGYSHEGGGRGAVIAFSYPVDAILIDAISGLLGMGVDVVVVQESALDEAIREWDKWATTNAVSPPDAPIPQPSDEPASELEEIKDIETVEPKEPPEIAAPSHPLEPPKPAPAESAPPDLTPDLLPAGSVIFTAPDEDEEILSVTDLHQIDETPEEAPSLPPVPLSETWEHIPPGGTGISGEPKEIAGQDGAAVSLNHEQAETTLADLIESEMEIDHSNPWEQVMPEGAEGASEPQEIVERGSFVAEAHEQLETSPSDWAESAIEVEHERSWEQSMPQKTGEKGAHQEIAEEESFLSPAHEQIDSNFNQGAVNMEDGIALEDSPEAHPIEMGESFISSPHRPNFEGGGIDIQSLENLIPVNAPPEGESFQIPDSEPESLPHEALEEVPEMTDQFDKTKKAPIPPKSPAAGPPQPPRPGPQLPPLPPAHAEAKPAPPAPGKEVTNADIMREIRKLREEVVQLSFLIEALVKKSGKS